MRLIIIIVAVIFCYRTNAQNLVIKNVNIVDVENAKIVKKKDVIISDGIIQSIEKSKGKIRANQIDGSGKYLMPGLIDAHIHLFQSGGLYTRPDQIDLRYITPYDEERLWIYKNSEEILKRYLSQGITSVIDIGGPMYNLAFKDSLNRLENTSRLFLTGPLISTYLPDALNVDFPPIIKAIDATHARELVNDQLKYNPDFIKIWFVILKPQDAIDQYPIIKAAIEEAKRHQKPIAIHAKELITAKISLELGVDYLVHSVTDVEVDDEFISLLKSSNAVYCPTMQVSSNFDKVVFGDYKISNLDYKIAFPKVLGSLLDVNHIQHSGDLEYYNNNKHDLMSRQSGSDSIMIINLEKIHNAGVPIVLGTDAGNIGTMHASSYFKEIEMFLSAGISHAEIIKSATINAAKAIHKDVELGTVVADKKADLLLLDNNPLMNIDHVRDIDLIIKDGTIIQRDSLILATPEDIVQQQLNAYNGHNLDSFMEVFAEDVKVYHFPNELLIDGKHNMREQYRFLENTASLHCELIDRTIIGKIIIDHQKITVDPSKPSTEMIAIYTVFEGKIATIHFIKNNF